MRTKVKFISAVVALESAYLLFCVLLRVDKLDRNKGLIEQVGIWPVIAIMAMETFLMIVTGNVAVQIYDAVTVIKADRVNSPSVAEIQERILKTVHSKVDGKIIWYIYSKNKKLTLGKLELVATGFKQDNADELVRRLKEQRIVRKRKGMLPKARRLFNDVRYRNGRLQLVFNEAALVGFVLCGSDEESRLE